MKKALSSLILLSVPLALMSSPVASRDVRLKAAWKAGDYDWPSAYVKPLVNDWSGYDRLVMDVTNLADDGDVITLVLKSPTTPRNAGQRQYLRAPAWSTVRWVFPIAYFEDGKTCVTNVTQLHFYAHRPKGINLTFSNLQLLKSGEREPAVTTPASLVAQLTRSWRR